MQRALEALDAITDDVDGTGLNTKPSFDASLDAITALRAALAEPEYPQGQASTDVGVPVYVVKKAEPVAWIYSQGTAKVASLNHVPGVRATPLYTAPPQRKPLTDDEIKAVIQSIDPGEQYLPKALRQFARAIEAAHGIKEQEP
jgi:hypothetical protein